MRFAGPGETGDQRASLSEASSGVNWLVGGGTFDSSITAHDTNHRQNIDNLGFAWALDIDSAMGLSVEPVSTA